MRTILNITLEFNYMELHELESFRIATCKWIIRQDNSSMGTCSWKCLHILRCVCASMRTHRAHRLSISHIVIK